MKPKSKLLRRAAALALAAVLAISASGCSGNELQQLVGDFAQKQYGGVVPGKRLNNSAWINSDLDGAVDASTQVSLRDDFHTAVNLDWLLATELPESGVTSPLYNIQTTLDEQLQSLFDEGEFACDPAVMPQAQAEHLQELVLTMSELAGDWQQRNSLGVEPLRPYLDAIDSIADLDAMTRYLCGQGGPRLFEETLLNVSVRAPISSRETYAVHLSGPAHLLLTDATAYDGIGTNDQVLMVERGNAVRAVLERFGYTQEEADALFERCWWFEAKLCRELPGEEDLESALYTTMIDNVYTLDMLASRQGGFPLTTLLESAGLAQSESFILYYPLYLSALGRLYSEAGLEDVKAYLTVHTVLDGLPLLDESCLELNERISARLKHETPEEKSGDDEPVPPIPTSGDSDGDEEPQKTEAEERLNAVRTFVSTLMPGEIQQLYVARYCTAQARQDICTMIERIVKYYKTMLEDEQWLSEQTREKAVEKLESITAWVLYSDAMPDYGPLKLSAYEQGGTLPDAVAAVAGFESGRRSEKVNQPIDRTQWDMTEIPTAMGNAVYLPDRNTIAIMAGFLSDGFLYDPEAPRELNMARLGTIVGHEISHAFDTAGYKYDKDGLQSSWWTNEDEVAFRLRADKLANHYSTLPVFPGQDGGSNGDAVKTEAIADMGGMKAILGLAAQLEDFDYELFFTSYAQMWAIKNSYGTELLNLSDVHPLGFLRTNVTVQQFEQFYNTFDIGPGDGMYLKPEDRILVW